MLEGDCRGGVPRCPAIVEGGEGCRCVQAASVGWGQLEVVVGPEVVRPIREGSAGGMPMVAHKRGVGC